MEKHKFLKHYGVIAFFVLLLLLVAKVLNCGCVGGTSKYGTGFACGCARRPPSTEEFGWDSISKVGEFIGASGVLAADAVASAAVWGAGNTMDGIRHAGAAIQGKHAKPAPKHSFWIW
jgi:hypothetical protein